MKEEKETMTNNKDTLLGIALKDYRDSVEYQLIRYTAIVLGCPEDLLRKRSSYGWNTDSKDNYVSAFFEFQVSGQRVVLEWIPGTGLKRTICTHGPTCRGENPDLMEIKPELSLESVEGLLEILMDRMIWGEDMWDQLLEPVCPDKNEDPAGENKAREGGTLKNTQEDAFRVTGGEWKGLPEPEEPEDIKGSEGTEDLKESGLSTWSIKEIVKKAALQPPGYMGLCRDLSIIWDPEKDTAVLADEDAALIGKAYPDIYEQTREGLNRMVKEMSRTHEDYRGPEDLSDAVEEWGDILNEIVSLMDEGWVDTDDVLLSLQYLKVKEMIGDLTDWQRDMRARCPEHGGMKRIHGDGWDHDRLICTEEDCGNGVVLDVSTEGDLEFQEDSRDDNDNDAQ